MAKRKALDINKDSATEAFLARLKLDELQKAMLGELLERAGHDIHDDNHTLVLAFRIFRNIGLSETESALLIEYGAEAVLEKLILGGETSNKTKKKNIKISGRKFVKELGFDKWNLDDKNFHVDYCAYLKKHFVHKKQPNTDLILQIKDAFRPEELVPVFGQRLSAREGLDDFCKNEKDAFEQIEDLALFMLYDGLIEREYWEDWSRTKKKVDIKGGDRATNKEKTSIESEIMDDQESGDSMSVSVDEELLHRHTKKALKDVEKRVKVKNLDVTSKKSLKTKGGIPLPEKGDGELIATNSPTEGSANMLAVEFDTSASPIEVGAKLREAREMADLTQERLEEITGIPKNTISRIENGRGKSKPNLDTVFKLIDATGVSVHLIPQK